MKCFLLAAALIIAIAATEGRRYGEKRILINKEIVYGPKLGSGIIGKKKSGFLDGFQNRRFIGGSNKGLGLGPRGRFGPGGRFGSNIPLVSGGINTPINGGLFPDPQFGGRFGQGGFSGGLGGFDQFGLQNGGRFGP